MIYNKLVESYTDIIVDEKESRTKRLKDRAKKVGKKAGKKAISGGKSFWKSAWS